MTTEILKLYIYISLFFYNLISKAICSDCTDFCLQIVFFGKRKKKTYKTFHILKINNILKMKTPFEKKHHILRMEVHSEMYFENENMFLEK